MNDKQSGVVGTSLFGNILIQVNPLIRGYEDWIRYVFAHEYHHTVWGNYWFVLHSGELEDRFIDSLVIDGEADSFALELYPALKPQWLFGIPETALIRLWEETYRPVVEQTGIDYAAYMFGAEERGIPWCAGYAVGYLLVQRYLRMTNQSVLDVLRTKPESFLPYIADLHSLRD